MAALKYGPKFESGPAAFEMPFAASQYFHELGSAFCYPASGNLTGNLTATTSVFAWALLGFSPNAPEIVAGAAAGSRYYKTGAAGTKYLAKILDPSEVFWAPAETAFVSATHRGLKVDIVGVNDGATKQTVALGTHSTNVLRCLDGSGTDVLVTPVAAALTGL